MTDRLRLAVLLGALALLSVGQVLFASNNLALGLWFFVPGLLAAIVGARVIVPRRAPAADDARPVGASARIPAGSEGADLGPRVPVWAEVVLVVLILGFGLFLRSFRVAEIPPCLFDDEANTALDAIRVVDHEITDPFVTGWYEVPTLYSYVNSISFRAFGVSIFAVRATGLAFAILTIAAMYFFCRYVFGVPLAMLGTAMFAASRFHITMSRWGASEIAPSFFMLMSFGFLLRGLQVREGMTPAPGPPRKAAGILRWPGWLFAASGLFLGLGLYTYLGSRLVALVVCLFMIALAVTRFDLFRRHFWRLALLSVVFWIVFAPLAVYYANNWLVFTHRWQDINIFKFCREAGNYGPFWESLQRHVLMFNWKGNEIIRHCMPGMPLLSSVSGVLFALGAAVSLRRIHHPFYCFVHLWFWLTLAGGVLSFRGAEESPCPYPVLTCAPAIYVFILIVALELWDAVAVFFAARALRRARVVFWAFLLTAATAASAMDIYVYFGIQAKDRRMWAHYNPVEHVAAQRIRELAKDHIVYLVPHYYTFSTVKLFNHPYKNIFQFLGGDALPFVVPDGTPVALIMGYNDDWIEPRLKEFYPNVRMRRYEDPVTPRIGFLELIIPEQDIRDGRGVIGTYTADAGRSAGLAETRREAGLALDFGDARTAPLPRSDAAAFQAVWEGAIRVPATAEYEFNLRAFEGSSQKPVSAEIHVAGTALTTSGAMRKTRLLPGFHPLLVNARGLNRRMRTELVWRRDDEQTFTPVPDGFLFAYPGLGRVGLRGAYFRNANWSGVPFAERIDRILSVTEELNDPYSIRWTGQLEASEGGTFLFITTSDDDSFVRIDGRLVVDNGGEHGGQTRQGSIELTKGWHDIEVLYANRGGGQSFILVWRPPNRPLTEIPATSLRPR